MRSPVSGFIAHSLPSTSHSYCLDAISLSYVVYACHSVAWQWRLAYGIRARFPPKRLKSWPCLIIALTVRTTFTLFIWASTAKRTSSAIESERLWNRSSRPCTLLCVRVDSNLFVFFVCLFVCLFDLILYVPSTIFQLNRDGSSCVEPVLS